MIKTNKKVKVWYIKCKATGMVYTKRHYFSKTGNPKIYTHIGHAKNSAGLRRRENDPAVFIGEMILTDIEEMS